MPVDLEAERGELCTSWPTWSAVFADALEAGWCPAGTLPPDDWLEVTGGEEEWPGTYGTNDCQHVAADDAKALALALKRASFYASGRWREKLLLFAAFAEGGDFEIC